MTPYDFNTINENMKLKSWRASTDVQGWRILLKFMILNPIKFKLISVEKA